MKDYEVKGQVVEVTLEDDRKVKIATEWVEKTMKLLDTDMDDVVLMWLEDNEYIVNEEQEELDNVAKENKVKVQAKATTERKKREVVKKEDPEKSAIIAAIAEMLGTEIGAQDVTITNSTKIVEFKIGDNEYKVDLIRKRNNKKGGNE